MDVSAEKEQHLQALADEIERMHKQFTEDMTARFGELPVYDEMGGEYLDPVHQTAWLAYNYGAEQVARRAPVVPELSNAQIREIFLANGFTIKDGLTDLKPYVYAAARALLAAAPQPPEQEEVAISCARCGNPWDEAAPVELPEPGIDTTNPAGVRVRGYTEQQVRALLASRQLSMQESATPSK